jgi:hypothetical protein
VSLADELAKLEELRKSETLTAQEFEDAKRALLYPSPTGRLGDATPQPVQQSPVISPGFQSEATEYFARQNRMNRMNPIVTVVGLIIFLIIAAIMCSSFSNASSDQSPFPDNGTTCTYDPDGTLSC